MDNYFDELNKKIDNMSDKELEDLIKRSNEKHENDIVTICILSFVLLLEIIYLFF